MTVSLNPAHYLLCANAGLFLKSSVQMSVPQQQSWTLEYSGNVWCLAFCQSVKTANSVPFNTALAVNVSGHLSICGQGSYLVCLGYTCRIG